MLSLTHICLSGTAVLLECRAQSVKAASTYTILRPPAGTNACARVYYYVRVFMPANSLPMYWLSYFLTISTSYTTRFLDPCPKDSKLRKMASRPEYFMEAPSTRDQRKLCNDALLNRHLMNEDRGTCRRKARSLGTSESQEC